MGNSATELLYRLLDFAQAKGLVEAQDRKYTLNRLMDILHMDAPEEIRYTPEAIPETDTKYLSAL